jgi:hypothetical protein
LKRLMGASYLRFRLFTPWFLQARRPPWESSRVSIWLAKTKRGFEFEVAKKKKGYMPCLSGPWPMCARRKLWASAAVSNPVRSPLNPKTVHGLQFFFYKGPSARKYVRVARRHIKQNDHYVHS